MSGGVWRSLLFSRLAALHCQARIPGALWLVHSSPLSTNQEAGPVQGHVWSQLIRISTEKDAISSLSSHDACTLSKTATYLHQQKTFLVTPRLILPFPSSLFLAIVLYVNVSTICFVINHFFCNQSFLADRDCNYSITPSFYQRWKQRATPMYSVTLTMFAIQLDGRGFAWISHKGRRKN